MFTFLEINGFEVEASDPELAAWIIGLSTGTAPVELAELVRARVRPLARLETIRELGWVAGVMTS